MYFIYFWVSNLEISWDRESKPFLIRWSHLGNSDVHLAVLRQVRKKTDELAQSKRALGDLEVCWSEHENKSWYTMFIV